MWVGSHPKEFCNGCVADFATMIEYAPTARVRGRLLFEVQLHLLLFYEKIHDHNIIDEHSKLMQSQGLTHCSMHARKITT